MDNNTTIKQKLLEKLRLLIIEFEQSGYINAACVLNGFAGVFENNTEDPS